MKTSDRLATILFLLAAPAARFLELKNNYDPAGLPTGGFPYLPAVLAAAAVVFLLSARGLPARDAVTADFGGIFRFDGQLTLTAAVLGGFLLLAFGPMLALTLRRFADRRPLIVIDAGDGKTLVEMCDSVTIGFDPVECHLFDASGDAFRRLQVPEIANYKRAAE